MIDLTHALADTGQPLAMFKALEKLADDTIGIKLFTLMTIDQSRGVAHRKYSNQPDAYPTSGNSIEEIAAVFPDYELIQSLGCESCLNLPIVINGTVIGTLNCLHEAGHYTTARIAAAHTLKQPGALAFLLDTYVNRSHADE
jgi:hypothetical protein